MLSVGYPDNLSGDCYHMWYLQTGKVTEMHDVIWLHCMYYQDDVNSENA